MSPQKAPGASSGVPAGTEHIRVSDEEREQAAGRLREHAAGGRITSEELDDRLGIIFSAHTRGDLAPPFRDLPGRIPSRSSQAEALSRRQAHDVRVHTTTYLLVSLALILVWAATGAGYFWPLWPVLGWGIGVLCHHRQPPGRRRATNRPC